MKKNKRNFKEKLIQWKKAGKALIYPEKEEEWDMFVEEAVANNRNITTTLKIMKLLENSEIDKAKELFYSKNYSSSLSESIRNTILEFSKEGPDFYESTNYVSSVDENIKAHKQRSLNNIYIMYENTAISKIPDLLEKGKLYIYPQREKAWKDYLEKSAKSVYHGKDVENALVIMDALDKGISQNDAIKLLLEQDGSFKFKNSVSNIIFKYSKRGPEFLEELSGKKLTPERLEIIEKKKQENAIFARKEKELHENKNRTEDLFNTIHPEYSTLNKEEKEKLNIEKEFIFKHIKSISKICSNMGLDEVSSKDEKQDIVNYVIDAVKTEISNRESISTSQEEIDR